MDRTGRLGQIKVYVGKFFRIFIYEKDWKVMVFALIIAGILSPVLGSKMFVIKESTIQGCFAIIASCIWIGIFNSIQTVCRERAIIKREHRTGLHITSYVAAHMIYQAGICLVQALVMTFMYHLFLDLPKKGLVTGYFIIDFFLILFLCLYAADMLGLAVSSLVRTPVAAMTVVPFVLIIQLLFSGTVLPLTGVARNISYFTVSKWGQRALCIESNINELPSTMLKTQLKMFDDVEGADVVMELLPMDDLEKFVTKHSQKDIYNYERPLVTRRLMYLLINIAVCALICVVSLEFIDKDKR